ncbi:DUF6420 family protein [Streptomyces sp. LRE541]|uniref:DUF6420 family protein n=1 Tax=Streptomyces sp. LRE541 TaxID=2931983 RepID=UPI00200EF6A0|nr:DUF6420 family protein [Streptomyces sp. LRE541]UPZ33813.1 DUF6420 family protein [Streptomyces sp. LRE541]
MPPAREACPHPDHAGPPGLPAQLTHDKNAVFERLALAAEGHCVHAPGANTRPRTRPGCCATSRRVPGYRVRRVRTRCACGRAG